MIGPSGQHDTPLAVFIHPVQGLLTGFTDIFLGALLLGPGGADGSPNLSLSDVPFFFAFAHQLVGSDFFGGEGNKGPDIMDLSVGDGLHIVFQVFRIGNHDGAVKMVLRRGGFFLLIEDTGVEDGLYPLFHQPLHMAVGQLGRIALRLRGDGFHTQRVQIAVREGGEDHTETQFLEKGCPEGIVFIQVEHPGDTDGAAVGFGF